MKIHMERNRGEHTERRHRVGRYREEKCWDRRDIKKGTRQWGDNRERRVEKITVRVTTRERQWG